MADNPEISSWTATAGPLLKAAAAVLTTLGAFLLRRRSKATEEYSSVQQTETILELRRELDAVQQAQTTVRTQMKQFKTDLEHMENRVYELEVSAPEDRRKTALVLYSIREDMNGMKKRLNEAIDFLLPSDKLRPESVPRP